jgi:1-aminocyclopropane-1-carboxylate deaminase
LIDFDQKLLISAPPLEHLNITNNTQNYNCSVLRLDKMNAWYGGNKYFKLKHNLKKFYSGNFSAIISFGGAYSNHIYSLAAIGEELGIKTIGFIRGLQLDNLTSTLLFAKKCGMQLIPLSRGEYSLKNQDIFLDRLRQEYPNSLIVPEGGCNNLGIEGCKEIVEHISKDFNYIVLACGTGSTLAGIVSMLKPHQKAIGISILKGEDTLTNFVLGHNPGRERSFQILFDYHFGGYAKKNKQLENFVKEFYKKNNIPLDIVYTAKAMAGMCDLLEKNYFEPNSKILFVHTGGLQNGTMEILN